MPGTSLVARDIEPNKAQVLPSRFSDMNGETDKETGHYLTQGNSAVYERGHRVSSGALLPKTGAMDQQHPHCLQRDRKCRI